MKLEENNVKSRAWMTSLVGTSLHMEWQSSHTRGYVVCGSVMTLSLLACMNASQKTSQSAIE